MYVIRSIPTFRLWMLVLPDGFCIYKRSWQEVMDIADEHSHYFFIETLDTIRQRINCE